MSIQEEFEKAKEGVCKEAAKVWVNAGYTHGDFKILKELVGDAIFNYQCKVDEFNGKLEDRAHNKGE